MAFKGLSKQGPPPESPQALYRDLPRRPGAVQGLWVHQGDLLRVYDESHADTPDLALELPTGTGKTLPGLLLLEYVRRSRRVRVVYACPTVQLTRQVEATAFTEGIRAVTLTGSHRSWDIADAAAYDAAEAIGIVTYSTIFNSSPKLSTADVLLFDDSHAGEQYVGEQYSVKVRRDNEQATYDQLLASVGPALDGMMLQRLQDSSPDPGVFDQIRVVFPLRQPGMLSAIDEVLSALDGDNRFRYSMIRGLLASCHVFVSYNAIAVRPLLPPTHINPLFHGARQRLYLSATLGGGGELERSFGRAEIVRLVLPEKSLSPRSGRRFFVFPDLVDDCGDGLTRQIVSHAKKALVLAPSTELALEYARDLAHPDWPILGASDIAAGMHRFGGMENATCGLAMRYDGLDLPGDSCRCVVLVGNPDQDNLQERFLSTRVRAGAALAERVRTRIVQGCGRCTRGPDDWAVVVICGAELTRYLMKPETLDALEPELQAEIRFGIENSRSVDASEVLNNVRTFVEQGDEWVTGAEPVLTEMRHDSRKIQPVGTDALAASADLEVNAYELAVAGRWSDASAASVKVARELGAGGEHTRGYRAVWLYLAGQWLDQAADELDDAAMHRSAKRLVEEAEKAAKPGTWTRELPPLPGFTREDFSAEDRFAISRIVRQLRRGVNKGKHERAAIVMEAGLESTSHTCYEPELTTLGEMLGAIASKPQGQGRCDSTWIWGDDLWAALEAKSEQSSRGTISHRDIRQASDQLDLLAADRDRPEAPARSVVVVVSPRTSVDPDGVTSAQPWLYLVHPTAVLGIAKDAIAAWSQILARQLGLSGDDIENLVADALRSYGVLPSQVLERLTHDQISAMGRD